MSTKKQNQSKPKQKRATAPQQKNKPQRSQDRQVRRKDKLMSKRQAKNSLAYDPTSVEPDVGIPYGNSRMAYDVPVSLEALEGVAVSVVSYALSRGWQEYTQNETDPVQAFRWIAKLLVNAAQNQIPASATGPKWLAMIMQALVQKNIPSRGGSVSYSATIEVPDNYPASINADRPIGPLVYARSLNFGVKTANKINGYFYTVNVSIPYDETQAQAAYVSLYNFIAKRSNNSAIHEKVSLSDTNTMTNDASAFTTLALKAGSGDGQVGGFYSTVFSEIPIRSPLFSCFRSSPGSNGDPGRSPNYMRGKGGDAYALSGLMISTLSPDQVHFKTPMRFKAVDFMEYAEVLALWVSLVQQKWVNDTSVNNGDPTLIQCPLTLQEFLLLLRANCMTAHSSSQHYAQSVFPRIPQNNNQNEFVAFVSAFGTCAYNAPAMRIPRLLKENIQGNVSRVVYGSRGGRKEPITYVGVLGKYFYDELNPKDFIYTVGSGEGAKTYLSFKEPSAFDPKRKAVVSVEDPINIIDGTSASDFVAINDPGALGPLSVLWNGWVEKIINYTTPLATNTNDGGVNVLRTLGMTNHWLPKEKETEAPVNSFYANREKEFIKLHESPYVQRRLEATTNQVPFIQGLWEGVLNKLIKPINLIQPATAYGAQTGYTSYAGQVGEYNTIVSGEGVPGGLTMAQMHENYALALVKDKFGAPSEIEVALNELDAQGKSGILSSLAGAFLGPGVGAVVEAIGLP